MTPRVFAGALALAVIAILAILAFREAPANHVDRKAMAVVPASPPQQVAPPQPLAPLPPPDTPLSAALPLLRAAAASGNDAASCRLAIELHNCAGSESLRSRIAELDRLPAKAATAVLIAKQRADMVATLKACDAVPPGDLVPWKLMLDAALRGHVPSMARFGGGVLSRSSSGEWDLDAIGAYRDHAYDFLRRAAEAGDVEAIQDVGFGLMTYSVGTRAIPFDPVRGLAYLKALSAHAAPPYRQFLESRSLDLTRMARMTPADIARAESEAASILPPASLDLRDDIAKPEHGAQDDFGCD
jgi:hypothetical protein